MKKGLQLLALVPMMFLLNSCEGTEPDNNGTNPDETPELPQLPEPPAEEKFSNVFLVDMFSTLQDEGEFFEMRSISSVSQHIANQSGKIPLVYMFDRADFTVGTSHLLNKLSYTDNIYQFFAQHEQTTSTVTKGTAIATKYPISVYDGIAQGGAYMSGCTISAPLTAATPVCIYTARISSLDQMKQIYEARSKKRLDNGVIVALVDNAVKQEVAEYVTDTMSLRAKVFGSEETKLDVMVVVPASYVCRSIEKGQTINLPYYRVRIEKWM